MDTPKLRLTLRQRRLLAVFTAAVMLLDNISTVLAVRAGARELNPLVAPFTTNTLLFALFTVAKCVVGFTVTYVYVRDKPSLAVWALILFFFLRATAINMLNAMGGGG